MKTRGRVTVWAVCFWLVVWELAALAMDQQLFLVAPHTVLVRLGALILTTEFWYSVCFSLLRIGGGFLLAVILGSLFAALAARFSWLRDLLHPLLMTIKAVPVASFIILALVLLPSRNLAVLIAFLMAMPVIFTNVLEGIQSTDRALLEMAQVYALPPGRTIRYIYLPQIQPFFLSALSISAGFAWNSGVAAEVIGMRAGSIGALLQQAKTFLDTPDLFAWTLTIVVLSILFEKLVFWLAKLAFRRAERMVP